MLAMRKGIDGKKVTSMMFRRDAVRMVISSVLTRPQVSSDLDVGLSTLNKWVQRHQHDDFTNASTSRRDSVRGSSAIG